MAKDHGGISSMGTTLTFFKVGSCSEALFNVLDRAFDDPSTLEERASMPLAGGIVLHGYQCGQLWGAALAAGARAHRLFGPGPRTEVAAIVAAGRLLETFRTRYGHYDCLELTDTDWQKKGQLLRYFVRGGPLRCYRMAARFAPIAYDEINAALADEPAEPVEPPVSCAAQLARKMGASDKQVATAAGLAGGIGLSGGACGALGAAVWLTALKASEREGGKVDYKDPRALAAIERFLEPAGHEFECAKIVGRRFDGVADHAAHLREGGCAELLEALAAG